LLDGAAAGALGGDEPDAGGSPQAETDPLVRNGLGSPLCTGAPGGAALAASSRRDCETSGFVAAAAPTGNFGIDIHIDTGLLGLSSAQLLSIVQNLFVTPLWMALVWAVHAVVVMLEWCFTIDLLGGEELRGGVARGLHEMEAAITMPWLALVLAIASVLCAYEGLVRRRVAESVAQVLAALVMMAGGVWVTVDPAGTVGALGNWANQASLGTLAVASRGTPADPGGSLATGMGLVFATAVEVPWCYLEFGDVDWCREPSRLDPQLHAAALALAKSELNDAGCRGGDALAGCTTRAGSDANGLVQSARLLRAARTNGAIFLALPPNGPARNAINDPASLLRAICRTETATDCRGPAAAAAEFRTNRGTWSRVGGLLLIAAGVVGMLLLLCFLALRLLGAAIFSLLFLMLAPVAALAPALGEPGRAAFRKWGAQLLGATVSKLLFAFLLGVVLAILAIIEHLEALGWWTRWLLMSAFWWGLFVRRHQILALAGGGRDLERSLHRRPTLRRVSSALDAGTRMSERVRGRGERSRGPAPELDTETARTPRRLPAGERVASDAERGGSPGAVASGSPTPTAEAAVPAGEIAGWPYGSAHADDDSAGGGDDMARLRHIADQRTQALMVGNVRRAARLATRAQRIAHSGRQATPREAVPQRGDASSEARTRHERFLDVQSRLAAGEGRGGGAAGRRSYPSLAGIAGYGRQEYAELDAAAKRAAREKIDRELALRKERAPIRRSAAAPISSNPHSEGDGSRAKPLHRGPVSAPRRPGASRPTESEVMRDAREVAAGRKRELGPGRP